MEKRICVFAVLVLLTACSGVGAQPPATTAPPPVISGLQDEIILAGEEFDQIELSELVAGDEVTWRIAGNQELIVEREGGIVRISPPSAEWRGWETLAFTACYAGDNCATESASFGVSREAEVTLTFINNAGFIIESGGTKISIDALFRSPEIGYPVNYTIMEDIANAAPPFNDLDIILATHWHNDHMDAGLTASNLVNNPQAVFISTYEGTGFMEDTEEIETIRAQIWALDVGEGESQRLAIDGVGIEAINLPHGPGATNYGYLVTIGGMRLFHTGDFMAEDAAFYLLDSYHIPERQITAALVPFWYLDDPANQQAALEGFGGDWLVPMHYRFTQQIDQEAMGLFPNVHMYENTIEAWVIPVDN